MAFDEEKHLRDSEQPNDGHKEINAIHEMQIASR